MLASVYVLAPLCVAIPARAGSDNTEAVLTQTLTFGLRVSVNVDADCCKGTWRGAQASKVIAGQGREDAHRDAPFIFEWE